jgi:hypothetical protein
MTGKVDDVRAEIVQAFGNSQYPGDHNLVIGNDMECEEVAEAFKGKEWDSLSPAFVREQKDALSLLTPEAFRYFFPAYLIACIDARLEVDTAWDSVIHDLTPQRESPGWIERRSEGFTPDQIAAIQAFLDLIDRQEQEYWTTKGLPRPDDEFREAIEYWASRKARTHRLSSVP